MIVPGMLSTRLLRAGQITMAGAASQTRMMAQKIAEMIQSNTS